MLLLLTNIFSFIHSVDSLSTQKIRSLILEHIDGDYYLSHAIFR